MAKYYKIISKSSLFSISVKSNLYCTGGTSSSFVALGLASCKCVSLGTAALLLPVSIVLTYRYVRGTSVSSTGTWSCTVVSSSFCRPSSFHSLSQFFLAPILPPLFGSSLSPSIFRRRLGQTYKYYCSTGTSIPGTRTWNHHHRISTGTTTLLE